jgi:hypothetical protein
MRIFLFQEKFGWPRVAHAPQLAKRCGAGERAPDWRAAANDDLVAAPKPKPERHEQ